MTKWTIPEELAAAEAAHSATLLRSQQVIDRLGAALNEILREAPSLQYAQQIARDALYPKEGRG